MATYFLRVDGAEKGHIWQANNAARAVREYSAHIAAINNGKFIGQVWCRNAQDVNVLFDACATFDAKANKLFMAATRATRQPKEATDSRLPIHCLPSREERVSLLASQYTILGKPAMVEACGQTLDYANKVKAYLPGTAVCVYLSWRELADARATGGEVSGR